MDNVIHMFEKLGYKYSTETEYKNGNFSIYYEREGFIVEFSSIIESFMTYYIKEGHYNAFNVDKFLMAAINKQMHYLGWHTDATTIL
jgi:hypothetical protein